MAVATPPYKERISGGKEGVAKDRSAKDESTPGRAGTPRSHDRAGKCKGTINERNEIQEGRAHNGAGE